MDIYCSYRGGKFNEGFYLYIELDAQGCMTMVRACDEFGNLLKYKDLSGTWKGTPLPKNWWPIELDPEMMLDEGI